MNKISSNYATRVTNSSQTILDHVITDILSCNYDLLVDDVEMSDHRYLLIAKDCDKSLAHTKTNVSIKSILNYENIEKHNLWNELSICKTFTDLIQRTLIIIKDNLEDVVSRANVGNKPWVTKNLITLIRDRNKFYKFNKKFPKDLYIKNKFNDLKKKTIDLNKKLKKQYFNKNFEECKDNPRKFWQFLKYAVFNKKDTIKKTIVIHKSNELI